MESEVKVFHSEISRVDCNEKSNLYELLKIEPAKPGSNSSASTKNETWEFKPKYDKHYSPKRLQSKLKVKTVSFIRGLYEKDVYTYLVSDLELQQNYLLRKICDGSSNEEKTRKTARSLLNADKPISRSAWQMLSNINPERHNHSKQFVLWNGKCIQVNGSRGGRNKFICNHDLKNKVKKTQKNLSKCKKSSLKSTAGLLRNSLNVKFKPGPLGKKKFLDASHHKHQMGEIEIVQLPAPVLEVSPAYGKVLEPTISSFVNTMRGEKGVIPQKFAEFAVSVLGTLHNNTAVQLDKNSCITFDLNYKCKQNRILMRRNVVKTTSYTNNENDSYSNTNSEIKRIQNSSDVGIGSNTNPNGNSKTSLDRDTTEPDDELIFEIKQIVNEMLDSVHINLTQDSIYSKEIEPGDTTADDAKDLIASKDKSKRKYCELDKLHVTIINLPESSKKDYTKPCSKSFCTKGCVCESLDCVFSLKQHCGVLDCMFGCKCEVSKYKSIELLEQDCYDIIPGLVNLDNEINSHMAKEEQKFHQTVIISGEKSIVLKSRKRNWKSSKKYAEFYSKMNLKGDENIKRLLTVDIEKLSCENIEPLCMVHNLYRCFCKGKFTETYVYNDTVVINTHKSLNNENTNVQHEITTNKPIDKDEITKVDPDSYVKNLLRPRLRKTYGNHKSNDFRKYSSNTDDEVNEISDACARTMGYHERKYPDDYYIRTNAKIIEMEENDSLLKNKMLKLINGKPVLATVEGSNKSSESSDCEIVALDKGDNDYDTCNEIVNQTAIKNKDYNHDNNSNIVNKTGENKKAVNKTANIKGEFIYPFANADGKGSLKSWLESSYKSYKERIGKGILKNGLEAPKKGKAALQSWDFILSRYRERKNIFVVSKQEPFRTFLAVDDKHPLFANCLNIDDIRFADLPKYPILIRNLVTNATDSENVFCILRGWDHCWELIGAAVKVIEQSPGSSTDDMDFFDTGNLMTKEYSSDNENDGCIDQSCKQVLLQEVIECNEADQDTSSDKSKWFVLTVENDFTEIQFYKKGFYVTYEGIQRSINLARISGKTVRLSSRARTDKAQNTHPYGIYAIPCTIQCCVFIGPYEVDEPLGIEVVKSVLDSRRLKKTRGVWIKTNKVDNMNVIDNPLAYLPSESIQSETIPIANIDNIDGPKPNAENKEQEQNADKKMPKKTISKHVKPIKIRRTNGFYHLLPKHLFQNVAKTDLLNNKYNATLLKTVDDSKIPNAYSPVSGLKHVKIAPKKTVEEPKPSTSTLTYIRPVAEIAPQIKITHVYSETKLQNDLAIPAKNNESTVHILRPEEINKKIQQIPAENDDFSTDIEKFLETSTICIAPQEEILVISDGEQDAATACKDVWIQCCNVENFGYIRAKTNDDGISFEFPGFKYSEYYQENEAFDKINQLVTLLILFLLMKSY